MKTYLKIKIKSLAAEAVIIKREERRYLKHIGNRDVNKPGEPLHIKLIYKKDHPLRLALRAHRIGEVRTECRSAHIAYGYLRGRAYKQIENKCHQAPNWQRIETLIAKYSAGPYYNTPQLKKQLSENLKAWAKGDLVKQAA